MPVLGGIIARARAGPSVSSLSSAILKTKSRAAQINLVTVRAVVGRTYATKTTVKGGRQSFSKKVERDERGNIIKPKKEQKLSAFKPMAPARLTHPLFQSDRADTLQLPTFLPDTVNNQNVGKALQFPLPDNDPARIFGLPKKLLLEYRILSKPCSIVRNVTVSTVERLKQAKEQSSAESRLVFTGRAGCGKSVLLLQSVEHCMADGWVVIYIPRAVNLVNSTTTYIYDLRTRTYLQPSFSYQTLQRLQTVNATALSQLRTSKKISLEKRDVAAGVTLSDLINVGLKDQSLAASVLDALLVELGTQTERPVLLAVDDFQAMYCKTEYRDPHFSKIRSHHLSLPRLILDYASGRKSFARGAFLGSITSSNPLYPIPIELSESLGLEARHAVDSSPYAKRSKAFIEYAKGLENWVVPDSLSVEEASGVFDVWLKDKGLIGSVYDELFLSKYTESSGNARDFVWKGLLASLES